MVSRKSVLVLGGRQSARIASKRAITDSINKTVGKGLLGTMLISALNAGASKIISKV